MKKYAKNCCVNLNPTNSPAVRFRSETEWASAGFTLPSAEPVYTTIFLTLFFQGHWRKATIAFSNFYQWLHKAPPFYLVPRSGITLKAGKRNPECFRESAVATTQPAGPQDSVSCGGKSFMNQALLYPVRRLLSKMCPHDSRRRRDLTEGGMGW